LGPRGSFSDDLIEKERFLMEYPEKSDLVDPCPLGDLLGGRTSVALLPKKK
jgi:hypothetical protein